MHWFDADLQEFNSHLDRTQQRRVLDEPLGIDLCSNDYLCLAKHPQLIAALKEGAEIHGAGSTASRLVRGHRDVFDRLERKYSDWVGAESALLFANGYAANVGCISAICDPSYDVFIDRLSHASLVDGVRLSSAKKIYFRHNDVSHLSELLGKSKATKKMIITETLFSMNGDFAPLAEIAALAQEFESLTYIDDAHAIGVYGEAGRGLAGRQSDFRMGTLGKALGLEGALVACRAASREYLLHNARTFVFSTAPMPMLAHAALVAIDLVRAMESERSRLAAIAADLRKGVAARGFSTAGSGSHIVPVICASESHALELAQRMQANGLHIKAIRPPTVKESRLRISLNVNIDAKIVERICQTL